MGKPKYIEYNGLRFCRDEKTGYYLNSTIRKRLHRYVWEQEVGEIPKGCHVHHINGDKSDNRLDNLSLLTASGHERLHGQEEARKEAMRRNADVARPYATEWHKSEEGRAWHSDVKKGTHHPRSEKACAFCGKTYQGTKQQRFCSNACKSASRRQSGVDEIETVCQQCGAHFMCSKYRPQNYCSGVCASRAHVGWYERKGK